MKFLKRFMSILLAFSLSFILYACTREEALFVYDSYYEANFDFDEHWKKQLSDTASQYKLKLVFTQADIQNTIPGIADILMSTGSDVERKLIILTPLLSGKLQTYFDTHNSEEREHVFLDLGYNHEVINTDKHITIPFDSTDIFRKAGEAVADIAGRNSYEVYAIISGDSPEYKLYKNAFSEAYNQHSGKPPVFIEIDQNDPNPQFPAMYLEIPETCLFFIFPGSRSPALIGQVSEQHYAAGIFIANLAAIQKNILFSVEYLPLVHFSRLLDIYRGKNTNADTDFIETIYFNSNF